MRGGREALARIIIWKEKKKHSLLRFFFGEHDELAHRGSGLIDDGLHDPARPPRPGPAHFTDPGCPSWWMDGKIQFSDGNGNVVFPPPKKPFSFPQARRRRHSGPPHDSQHFPVHLPSLWDGSLTFPNATTTKADHRAGG